MKNQKKVKDPFTLILASVLLLIGGGCFLSVAIFFAKGYLTTKRNNELGQQLQAATGESLDAEGAAGDGTDEGDGVNADDSDAEAERQRISGILSIWRETINEDIIGYLEIPDTNIAYPIVQTEDNDFYLTHNVEKENDRQGAIFADVGNEIADASEWMPFEDAVIGSKLILYGHNMKNLSMFGGLRYFKNETYLEEHPEIILYLDSGKYTFTIDEVRVISENNLDSDPVYDLTNKEETEENAHSTVMTSDGLMPNSNGEIVLSTCDAGESRLIIHGASN